jgi:6-pyruvoyltetrahydropterin 2'-reductase
MKNYLIISEQFYSIQGEGINVGQPAVFLRLAACNLTCKGFSYQDAETGEQLGCDTAKVWRKGERWSFEKILTHWQNQGWLHALTNGAHLVITGGEPLLQQAALVHFIETLKVQVDTFIEIETNATILFSDELLIHLNQINASPKLRFAGDAADKRVKPAVLKQLAKCDIAYFKFVLSEPEQINEIMTDYQQLYAIPTTRILLMPEGGTADIINANSDWLIELCKKYHLRYSPRLHIIIWGEVTGV